MHARLTAGERQKIETDIGSLVGKLSEAIGCGDNRIAELERMLEQQKAKLDDAGKEIAQAAQQQKDLEKQLAGARDEINTKGTDLKVLGMEINSLKKDCDGLQNQLGDSVAEGKQLAQQLADTSKQLDKATAHGDSADREIAGLRQSLAEFESTDKELRERIVALEKMLVKERQRAGQDLMARILELEAMLDVERRKVEDLPEIPEVAQVTLSKKASAANAESVVTTKKNLAKKMG